LSSSVVNRIRFEMGRCSSALGLREILRSSYKNHARSFCRKLPEGFTAAWIRRSVINDDFVPFWSDIDLTLFLPHRPDRLRELFTRGVGRDLLVHDIQLVSSAFADAWQETGGIRGRQAQGWEQLFGDPELHPKTVAPTRAIAAFELGHELHLLYRQLEHPLKLLAVPGFSRWDAYTASKLAAEIRRLQHYWQELDETILLAPRRNFTSDLSSSAEIEIFLQELETFAQELLAELAPPLGDLPFAELILEQQTDGQVLWLQMNDKSVFTFKHVKDWASFVTKHLDHYVIPESLLRLIKGVGVQEQTLLNTLAAREGRKSYYYRFNLQRLAHDLLGAMILDSGKQDQLFFCYQNIHAFLQAIGAKTSPHWPEIKQQWEQNRRFQYDTPALVALSLEFLELLEAVG
jgi:hypothetical protein